MERSPKASFVVALFISGGIVCIIALIITYFLALVMLGGGETVQETENLRIFLLLISAGVAFITFIIRRNLIKEEKLYTATGASLPPLIVLVILIVINLYYYNYHTPFDKLQWVMADKKPFSMTATLVKEDVLIGLTRKQVKEMLGEGYEYNNVVTSYSVENNWTMRVFFENNIVVSTELHLPSMMT